MNKIEKFEDLKVWQEGIKLTVDIYNELKDCRDFGLRDQMQKASVSIPSNIAEGYDRHSNKEYIHFLYIAKGSCSELRTQLYIALKTGTIQKNTAKEFIETTKKISAMLYNLIKVRKDKF
ncbi:MAG: four helix bundle protein [Candidatus Marinimicrobia bacterium]|nr:four helix bundle protein [Candidatus Neomarinimicrobiota bacterium]MBT5212826.1 four helix bundle protein [Candidatus Neomarinimicrobiota bacterium]MBT5539923.1 four helix bundle protein [Candidatus Neomarinimicrobiota bacterium]MBT7884895.1 four helix bundle protein [Candidatus Neomarinimicrobiota bacterium]